MSYFILAIILNASLGFVFKWMARKHYPFLWVIVINYLVCTCIGWTLHFEAVTNVIRQQFDWLLYPIFLGILFIGGFMVNAGSIKYIGLGPTAIFQRISLILTVLFAFLVWDEPIQGSKAIGLFLAIVAIFLVNRQSKSIDPAFYKRSILLLPFATLLISGIIDSSFFHAKRTFTDTMHDGAFTTLTFTVAGIIGFIYLLIDRSDYHRISLSKAALLGIILGIPNFFSIFTLVKAIDSGLPATVLFPVYNMSIICIASLGGILFFKEKMYFWNIAGLILALLAIGLISLT
jgi:drug/metabolite transporter (DMT)-like permease